MEAIDIKNNRKRTKSSITPQQMIELGKLPPKALDLEMAVLGAIMLDSNCLVNIIDILKPDIFYAEKHQRIFAAIASLFEKGDAADILTVTQQLKRMGELEMAGGATYITQLTNRIASTANIEVHARIVIEKYIQREIIRISTDTLQHAYEDSTDIFDLLHKAEENIFSISHATIRKTFEHIKKVIAKSLSEIEAAKNQEFNGIPSGFTSLDRITGGWQKTDLIVLAARPGRGKSALMLSFARNPAVDYKKGVAIFSLEMPSTQLINRMISAETEINAEKLRRGEITESDWQNIHENIGRLAEAPIYIDDTPALSIFEFRAKAKRLVKHYGVSLIIIDYLQLMTAGDEAKYGTREQQVAYISNAVKATAKELDIPIIALAQMSRAVEQRGGSKRPQLSDLRDSGAIEMDADIVMFIYRPELEGITQDENGMDTQGQAEIIIAKHRNGKIDNAHLSFIDHLAKFVEASSDPNTFKDHSQNSSKPTEKQFEENAYANQRVEPNRDFMNQGPRMPYSERNDDFDLDA